MYNTAGTATYYAHWTANSNTVTWNASTNGGAVNGSNSVKTSVTTGATATAPSYTPVKTGHTFKGWYTTVTGSSLYNAVSQGQQRSVPERAASPVDGGCYPNKQKRTSSGYAEGLF